LLALDPAYKSSYPVLKAFFDLFDHIEYEGKPVSSWHYLVIGQACIDKNYRGKGMLKKLYAAFSNQLSGKYDFAISEIATRNLRSMNAHKRLGFTVVHEYTGPDGVRWSVVILDWTKSTI
jgi:L-amino acid N-acyltransferase YncA